MYFLSCEEIKTTTTTTLTGVTCQLFNYTVQLQACRLHCPISAQIGVVITNHVQEIAKALNNTVILNLLCVQILPRALTVLNW